MAIVLEVWRPFMYAINLLNINDLSAALSDAIGEMRAKYPLLSSQALAKRLGIPNATFDRLSKQEVKNPSLNHAITIAREVCGGDSKKIQQFIRKYYPDMAPVLANWSSLYYQSEDASFIDERLGKHMADPTSYEIFLLMTSRAGVSREFILEEYGRRGAEVIEKLQGDELLEEREGRLYAEGDFHSTQNTVLQCAQNLLNKNYSLDDFGTGKNWLSVQWQSVNPDYVAPRLREVFIRARQKIEPSQ